MRNLIHLCGSQELRLIHENPSGEHPPLLMHPADCLIKVTIRVHPFALTLYADTAPDNVARLTRIGGRLEAEIGNPLSSKL